MTNSNTSSLQPTAVDTETALGGVKSLLRTVGLLIGMLAGKSGAVLMGVSTKDTERTPEDVLAILDRFSEPGDLSLNWDLWNDFVSTPIKDESLETLRLECGDVTYEVDEVFADKVRNMADTLRQSLNQP